MARGRLRKVRSWSVPILGGSPRKLGDLVGETGAWSPDGKWLAYTNLGDLFVARTDGTESRKVLSVKGDILNVTWSPDSGRLRFDSSITAGAAGQQLEWEVSPGGNRFASLVRRLARSSRRMLRQMDGRRKILCISIEQPDLGGP